MHLPREKELKFEVDSKHKLYYITDYRYYGLPTVRRVSKAQWSVEMYRYRNQQINNGRLSFRRLGYDKL
jgi:hypothetical protein